MATDVYKEWLREMELLRNPGPNERSYETEDKRNDKSTAAAADGIADSAANRSDDDVDQECCKCHGNLLLFVVILVIFIWNLLFVLLFVTQFLCQLVFVLPHVERFLSGPKTLSGSSLVLQHFYSFTAALIALLTVA
jgi:hypothetical protein